MKRLITARDVEEVRRSKGSIIVSKNVIITPSAKDLIRQYQIKLVEENLANSNKISSPDSNHFSKTIYLASTPGSSDYQQKMKSFWEKLGYKIINFGFVPDEAAFSERFREMDKDGFLIFIAENGFKETVWFNKITRFTAVRCSTILEARTARQEINADTLVLGSELVGWKQALKTAHAFVTNKEE